MAALSLGVKTAKNDLVPNKRYAMKRLLMVTATAASAKWGAVQIFLRAT